VGRSPWRTPPPPNKRPPKGPSRRPLHHQGVILFSVRGKMHGRRQQAACSGTGPPGGRSQGRARMSSELLAQRCSMERHSRPKAQATLHKVHRQPGHEQPPVPCSAAHQLPSQEKQHSLFFWRLPCAEPRLVDRGSMAPGLIASRRGGPPEISVAPGAKGGPRQRWTAEIGPEDWLLELL
jgi:hypothetical protein